MYKYEVYLKVKGDKEPKLYGEYETDNEAKIACETVLLTTKNITKLFIGHQVS